MFSYQKHFDRLLFCFLLKRVHCYDQALQIFLFGVVAPDVAAVEFGFFVSSLFLKALDKDLPQLLWHLRMMNTQSHGIQVVCAAYLLHCYLKNVKLFIII